MILAQLLHQSERMFWTDCSKRPIIIAKNRSILYRAFKNGFSIGYKGKTRVRQTAPNLKFNVGDEIDLWNKVMKEVQLKRYVGPFDSIPFRYYIQSPIGLVPKDGEQDTRLIFHLSYPQNSKVAKSVNACTPKDECLVKYPDFSEAIILCLQELQNTDGSQPVYLSRSDMKAAFRNLGVIRKHWRYMVMKARSPLDKKWYYFYDKCLAFGTAKSCAIFQAFSDCIAYLVKTRTGKRPVNFLDDYLFISLMKWPCNHQMQTFLDICKEINFPVAMEKMFLADTTMVFLGFLINTVDKIVSIPVEKVIRARNMIQFVLNKKNKKLTLLQLQKICGFLNFLGRAVVPGRAIYSSTLWAYEPSYQAASPHQNLSRNQNGFRDLA